MLLARAPMFILQLRIDRELPAGMFPLKVRHSSQTSK
jgi:hypothetical protein